MIDKDSLPLDKPRRTPGHPTKSHVVKTRVDGKEKIIRFGEQGASTAGKPKEGESEAMKQKRASFKARHAKNIAKGKSSPAFWADKVKWKTGGSVELEDLDEKYAGIKKPDFKMLESFKDLIRTLQARAEDSGTQEFDPVRALGRSGAAGSLEDLYEAYSDKPAPHASRAEAGAKDPKRTETAKMVFDSFKNAGFSDAQAKALTAEINREGSFNPAYLYGSHTDAANKATNVGMLSWQGDRANRLMSFMADRGLIDPAGRIAPGQDALNAQAEYLRWEMENDPSYTRTRETFLANPDIDQETAHDILGKNFIRWRIDDPKYRGSGFERISEGYDLLNMAQGFAEGGLAELDQKYKRGGKKKDDDELARASMLADLELMAQPKNPKAVPAEDPRLLNVGGLEERLALLNQTFNPVEAIGGAMRAGRDLMDPEAGGYDRLAALGNMLSGVAGVAGPAAIAKRVGAPAATAVMESLLGASPTAEAVADMARKYAVDEYGGVTIPRAPFDMGNGASAPTAAPKPAKPKKGAPRPEADPAGPFAPKNDPRYVGAAPDRSEISFLRYKPKAPTGRVERALAALRDPSNPVRADMFETIRRGMSPEIRGQDWYNTEELRDWFVSELGEDAGNAEWSQFMDLMGAGSPMSNVPSNIKSASAMRNRLATDPEYAAGLMNVEKLDDARVYGSSRPAGYGHQSQGLQELIHARQRQGAWSGTPEPGVTGAMSSMTDNPKPKGFTNSLKGNMRNIAADLHFTRFMAMASNDPEFLSGQAGIGKAAADAITARFPKAAEYIAVKEVKGKPIITFNAKKAAKEGAVDLNGLKEFDIPSLYADKPNDAEYAHFEDFMKEVGDELGMTPAQTQAALWMGAADRTGLDQTSRGTFMDLFRRRVGERAAETGRTFDDTLRDFIRNKGLLSVPIGIGAMSMQSAPAEAGSIEDLDQKYAEGGEVNTDDELKRAILLRDLDLMAQERSPDAVPAQDPSLLNVGGVGDRLALINKYLNPVEAIGESMDAGSRMMSPGVSGYDRVAALGDMLSGVAGVAGPAAVAKRVGAPAANAVMDALVGGSPTSEALSDMARKYAVDESGALRLPSVEEIDPAALQAEEVLDLLRSGREDEITEQMLDMGDPVLNARLNEYLYRNYDLPMDYESRMARAAEMGALDEYHGTTTGSGMRYPRADFGSGTRKGTGFFTSSNPYVASSYADPLYGSVFPMKNTPPPSGLASVDVAGDIWSQIPGEATVSRRGMTLPVSSYASGSADMGGVFDTNQIARGAALEGDGGVRFLNLLDRSIHLPRVKDDPSVMREFQEKSSVPSTVTTRQDTRGMRSRFARFDPRLAHLRNLSAGVAAGAIGASQYDPDAIETTATRVRENKFAAGGAVKYDPAAVDGIINKLREVNRG